MKKRMFAAMAAASKSVSFLVVLVMAVVFNFLMTGCDRPEDDYATKNSREYISTTTVDKPTAPTAPDLSWSFGYENRNKGWELTTNWWVRETTNQFNDAGVSRNAVSHKDDRYAVTSVSVNLQEVQERTYAGQLSTKTVSNTMTRKVFEDSRRWTATVLGNLCYFDAADQRIEAEVRDTLRQLPYVRTVDANVEAVNILPGTTAYTTRGTYVSDSACVEVVWKGHKEVVGNGYVTGGENFIVELRDTFKVLLLSEDDIARGYLKSKERIALDNENERCSFTEVLVMKSGEEHEYTHNYVLNRWIKNIPEWLENVTSFGFTHKSVSPIEYDAVQRGIRKENGWTVDGRKFTRRSQKTNGYENITMVYNGYSEGCVYEDQWIRVEFPILEFNSNEMDTHVESINSDNEGYEQARLFNTISTEYLGWNQNVSETVKLQMPKAAPEIEIVSEGWDYDNYTEIIYNDSIVRLPVYVIVYSDGNRVNTKFHFVGDRGLENYKTFDVIEDNESERTGSVNVVLSASREMSGEDKGATATWKRNTYELSNGVQLNTSRQENHWRSVESEDFECTYRGRTFTAPRHNISTSNVSNVSGGNVVGQYKVFNYTDDLTYNYGDNSKNSVAKGTIRVPAVTIVSEGWDASSAREVWSDTKVNWSIDWVVKFSDGTEDRTSFAADAPRTFTVDPAWLSIELNANYSTGNYVVTVTNSENQSKTVNGATFNWTRETRSIKTNVQLAGSTQVNTWHATDPFGCKVTYKGQTYDFGRKNMSLSHQDNLTGGSEIDGYKVYNYTDRMNYTVGENTKSLDAKGTIKVKVEEPEIPTFFPKDWGELLEIKQTVANNKTHDGYVYTWSLRFKNNIVLPVVVERGSTNPSWNFNYAEFTLVTTYNGGTYEAATGNWVNTTATDQTNHMVWTRDGGERANKNYREAKAENWDEGHLIGNRPSTQTSRYNFSIVDGVLSATDTYTGKFMGTWSSYVAK